MIFKFQQGGAVDQIKELVSAAMNGDEKAQAYIMSIKKKADAGDKQSQQIFQVIQQMAQQMSQSAKNGAKLIKKNKFGGSTKKGDLGMEIDGKKTVAKPATNKPATKKPAPKKPITKTQKPPVGSPSTATADRVGELPSDERNQSKDPKTGKVTKYEFDKCGGRMKKKCANGGTLTESLNAFRELLRK